MPYVTNYLVEEHELILRMIQIVGKINKKLMNGESIELTDLRAIVDFIRNFADHCHHAKEEDLLFKKMGEKGFSPEQGPVAVMLYEHELGRNFVKAMEEGIDDYEKGNYQAAKKIAENAGRYSQLLAEHIHKENNILYPMADRIFSDVDQQILESEFQRVEKEELSGLREKYQQLVETFEKKYLE